MSSLAPLSALLAPTTSPDAHCCLRAPRLQGLWGLKGVSFKLPDWIAGKKK